MKDDNKCIRLAADSKQIANCQQNLSAVGESIQLISKALNLAGNEVRLKILFLLYREKNLCVCDLSDILSMSAPAISQHLRKMKDGGVVYNVREAQTIFYSIEDGYLELFEPFFKRIESGEMPLGL